MKATVVLIIKNSKILLALKGRKIGKGKWNGYGGKQKEIDATIRDTAVRELFEESGKGISVRKEDLIPCALIDFFLFKNDSTIADFSVVFYTAETFTGTAVTTAEMRKPTWFPVNELPNNMRPADHTFFSKIIAGETFKGTVRFTKNGKSVLTESYTPCNRNLLEAA